MKKFYLKDTNEEIHMGDTVECKVSEDNIDYLLEIGIIAEEEDKDYDIDALDQFLDALDDVIVSFDERISKLERKMRNICKAKEENNG